MVFRSAYHPIFVGLGTAAILAAGASSAGAVGPEDPSASSTPAKSASPTPSPTESVQRPTLPVPVPTTTSPTPTPTPKPVPKLFVGLSWPSGKLYPGDSGQATLHVHATGAVASEMLIKLSSTPKVTLTPKCVVVKGACRLTKVGEAGTFMRVAVRIPKSLKPGKVTLTVRATDPIDKATAVSAQRTFKVSKKPAPTPTPSPSKTSSGSTGSGSGSGLGTGAGTGGSSALPPLPSPAAQAPNVALPPVVGPPVAAPSVAPGAIAAPSSTLRAGTDSAPSELTFERLAGTQAAWLAALLAALSLLLTQVRINRIAMGYRRPKGDHRRPRHGLFGR